MFIFLVFFVIWSFIGIYYFMEFDCYKKIPNKNKYRLLIICCGFFVWIIEFGKFIYLAFEPIFTKIDEWFQKE